MKIKIDVPDGISGDWKVSTFEVSEKDANFFNLRAALKPGYRIIDSGTYKKLTCNNQIVMSNTPAEIADHLGFIYEAERSGGNILINGLGLGVALRAILKYDNVKAVTVIEKSKDVIKLVAPSLQDDARVNIINADAYDWKPPKEVRYNVVWHDIWENICEDNLPEMTRLHRKYGKRADWQSSWCKELCKRLR